MVEHAAGPVRWTEGPCHRSRPRGFRAALLDAPAATVISALPEAAHSRETALFPPGDVGGVYKGCSAREEEQEPQGPHRGTGRSGVHEVEGVGPPRRVTTRTQPALSARCSPFWPDHITTGGT